MSWSELEVELIVADYFSMLAAELADENYSKAEHRRTLMPLLNNRSEGSIEFKHQNISAVLINLGQLYIRGYLPRYNYQKILEEKVIDYLILNNSIEKKFKLYVDKVPRISGQHNFNKLIVNAPAISAVSEPPSAYNRNPIKINYLEKEQKNSKLGALGEKFILEYEKWHLIKTGKEKLAEEVKWISQEEGDGAGFDILSKNLDGTDKYVEVKTTTLGKETPFFFSRNELLFSEYKSDKYHLYRLFNFEKGAQLFIKNGNLGEICNSFPISYKGFF
ncbi:DUF3883 domain-containing protein [Salinimicrobium xinjiangense]|uniref:DUF3883 domain-containing protein n=1 Tax=Salinimicrobium xinjiangense TaxID=438596 RepID=UPI0004293CCC|nr:DUF3883 domain-containing protein [Salinimicrobium xinjiangense]